MYMQTKYAKLPKYQQYIKIQNINDGNYTKYKIRNFKRLIVFDVLQLFKKIQKKKKIECILALLEYFLL